MGKSVTFEHRPARIVQGADCDLVYANRKPVAAIIPEGGTYTVRAWTEKGRLGNLIAVRGTHHSAFEAAIEFHMRKPSSG